MLQIETKFICIPDYDIGFIPYMPATVKDNTEIRVQIKNVSLEAAFLNIELFIDRTAAECKVFDVKNAKVESGAFFFFKYAQKYPAGEHRAILRYKDTNEYAYSEAYKDFLIKKDKPVVLEGGFAILGPPNDRVACSAFCKDIKRMTDADWVKYIDALHSIGQKLIVVQETINLRTMGDPLLTAHFPTDLYPRSDLAASDAIGSIFKAAERNGQYVFLGLGHPYGAELGSRLKNVNAVMGELFSLYGKYKSFYGWYASSEANLNEDHESVWEYLLEIRAQADKLSPVKPIMISPYIQQPGLAGAGADLIGEGICYGAEGIHPRNLQRMQNDEAVFDIMAPQDQVGAGRGKLPVSEAGKMFETLQSVCAAARKHLWANCEAFDFNDDQILVPRFRDGGMDGENGFIQQIRAVHPVVEKVITFGFNGFFTPPGFNPCMGGSAAVKQFNDYKKYYDMATGEDSR